MILLGFPINNKNNNSMLPFYMLEQFFSGHSQPIILELLLMFFDHFSVEFLCVQDRLVHYHQHP